MLLQNLLQCPGLGVELKEDVKRRLVRLRWRDGRGMESTNEKKRAEPSRPQPDGHSRPVA
jgi:hypothetical protein